MYLRLKSNDVYKGASLIIELCNEFLGCRYTYSVVIKTMKDFIMEEKIQKIVVQIQFRKWIVNPERKHTLMVWKKANWYV